MSQPAGTPPRTGILTLTIRSRAELYQAWMPFIAGGGLFVATPRPYALGEEAFILLSFMDEPAKIPLHGTVAWINPENATGGRPQGIGVKLNSDPAVDELKKRIDGLLAGVMNSPRPTHTL
jgi:type IV pilus assembly protein PilZ